MVSGFNRDDCYIIHSMGMSYFKLGTHLTATFHDKLTALVSWQAPERYNKPF